MSLGGNKVYLEKIDNNSSMIIIENDEETFYFLSYHNVL